MFDGKVLVFKTVLNSVDNGALQPSTDGAVADSSRSTFEFARASTSKNIPDAEPNISCSLRTQNSIFTSAGHLPLQSAESSVCHSLKCEKKFVDACDYKLPPMTDHEGGDSRCISEASFKESEKCIYCKKERKSGLGETNSEPALQLNKKKLPVVLSNSYRSFQPITNVPLEIEKCDDTPQKQNVDTYALKREKNIQIIKPIFKMPKDETFENIQESVNYFQLYPSPPEYSSRSTRVSQQTKTSSQKSNSCITIPCQSTRESSISMCFLQNDESPCSFSSKQSLPENSCAQQILPAQNLQHKNNRLLSFCFSPPLVYSKKSSSSLPADLKCETLSSSPHKCSGLENLHKGVKRLKWLNPEKKRLSILKSPSRRAQTDSENEILTQKPKTIKRKRVIKSASKSNGKMLAICDSVEKKVSPKKRPSFERKKDILVRRSSKDTLVRRSSKDTLVRRSSLVSANNINSVGYCSRSVSRERALVPVRKKKRVKKTIKASGNAKPQVMFSTDKIYEVKSPNVQHYSHKWKVPLSRKGSMSNKLKQSLMESSIAHTYTAFTRNGPISTTPSCSRKKSPTAKSCALVRKSFGNSRQKSKSPKKPKYVDPTDYTFQARKVKIKTTKNKSGTKKSLKGSPRSSLKVFSKSHRISGGKFKRTVDSDCQTEPSIPISAVDIAHCQINNEISYLTNSDLKEQGGPNHDKACWNSLHNTSGATSAFYTKFCSWSKNCKDKYPLLSDTRNDGTKFILGGVGLPDKKLDNKKQLKSVTKCSYTNHASNSICLPSTTSNHAAKIHSQNQCNEVAILPTLLSLLKSMDTTISSPIKFNKETVHSSEPVTKYQGDVKLQRTVNPRHSREQIAVGYGPTDSRRDIALFEKNFTEALKLLALADNKWSASKSDHLTALKESIIAKEMKNSSTTEAKRTRPVTDEVQPDKKRVTAQPSFTPRSSAASILRKGHISSPNVNIGQFYNNEITNTQLRNRCVPQHVGNNDSPWDQSSHSSTCSISIIENQKDHRMLTIGFIVVTIIMQALIYFSVPVD